MFRRLYSVAAIVLVGLSLSAFSHPLSEAEETGNPWWMWLLIVLALIAFAAFAIWWWRGSRSEEEHEGAAEVSASASAASEASEASEATAATVAAAEEVAVQLTLPAEEEKPTEPDDLTRVEGIGSKISSVLQAAGINTYTALASTDAAQIRLILGDESPNLLRLADPTTWPQQAELAAAEDWDRLDQLQDRLKGGWLEEGA